MCRALSPASFLAVAFRASHQEELDYGWLNCCRSSMRAVKFAGESVDVAWDHDSVNYTMGFFAPVFSASTCGVRCNLNALDLYFDDITRDIDKRLLAFVRSRMISCSKKKKVLNGRRKVN